MDTFLTHVRPFLSARALEAMIPHQLLQSSHLDLALGRARFADTLGTYGKSKKDPQFAVKEKQESLGEQQLSQEGSSGN